MVNSSRIRFSAILGISAIASAVTLQLPTLAESKIYQNVEGSEFVKLDPTGLDILESIGLTFASANTTSEVPDGFDVVLDLLPTKSESFFSFDDNTGAYAFLGEREKFSGSLIFDVNQSLLNLEEKFEVGNFSAIYLPTGEVFLQDNISTGLPLFFPQEGGNFSLDFENFTSSYKGVPFVISPQFSDFLSSVGASQSVAGIKIAEGLLTRKFVEANSSVDVPEPELGFYLWGLLGIFFMFTKPKSQRSCGKDFIN